MDAPLGNVSLVLRSWEQHAPPADTAATVVVTVAAVHARGGRDLTVGESRDVRPCRLLCCC